MGFKLALHGLSIVSQCTSIWALTGSRGLKMGFKWALDGLYMGSNGALMGLGLVVVVVTSRGKIRERFGAPPCPKVWHARFVEKSVKASADAPGVAAWCRQTHIRRRCQRGATQHE